MVYFFIGLIHLISLCGSTVLDMLESMEMTEQTDWWAKTGVKGNDRADRLAGKDSCGSAVLDMLESMEMTEQIDWWAKTGVNGND